MNFIQKIHCDDDGALDALARNQRLGSYPHLRSSVPALKAGYAQYRAANGNAITVINVQLSNAVADYLKGHYHSPPRDLHFIKSLREDTDWDTCPMCGSLHSGTIDHFLDKDTYPAFSIFTPNLVPACKCNSLRGPVVTGIIPGERILHPYFDMVLNDRIIAAHFTDLGKAPLVQTRVILDENHPSYLAANFHHNKVVVRTSIKRYLISRWSKLVLEPNLIIPDLKINPKSRANLVSMIEEERARIDRSRGSKNNWDSVMLSGLLDDSVVDWLYDRLTRPGRQPKSALI